MSPSPRAIDDQNRYMQRRQEQFRIAADYVTRSMSSLPAIAKIALFGSVAKPLFEEVPRFREYRRASIKVLHECKDLDLAVWVSDLSIMREMQRARSRALKTLLDDRNIGVAHHQVDVFIMEPGSDRYLGRLCDRSKCPAMDEDTLRQTREILNPKQLMVFAKEKPCVRPGCGEPAHLKQDDPDGFDARWLANAVTSADIVLFDRSAEGVTSKDASP